MEANTVPNRQNTQCQLKPAVLV